MTILTFSFIAILALALLFLYVRLYSVEKRVSMRLDGQLEIISKQTNAVTALRKEFDDVVYEDIKARAEGERLWNEGLSEIINYGSSIPALNKENMRYER